MIVKPIEAFQASEADILFSIHKAEEAIKADQHNKKALLVDNLCLQILKLELDRIQHPENAAEDKKKIDSLTHLLMQVNPPGPGHIQRNFSFLTPNWK